MHVLLISLCRQRPTLSPFVSLSPPQLRGSVTLEGQLTGTLFAATVSDLHESYYVYVSSDLFAAHPQVSRRFQRMLEWADGPISSRGRPQCSCELSRLQSSICVCPESFYMPIRYIEGSITNKQGLLENIKSQYFKSGFCDMY